jgi:hypothetical protein
MLLTSISKIIAEHYFKCFDPEERKWGIHPDLIGCLYARISAWFPIPRARIETAKRG